MCQFDPMRTSPWREVLIWSNVDTPMKRSVNLIQCGHPYEEKCQFDFPCKSPWKEVSIWFNVDIPIKKGVSLIQCVYSNEEKCQIDPMWTSPYIEAQFHQGLFPRFTLIKILALNFSNVFPRGRISTFFFIGLSKFYILKNAKSLRSEKGKYRKYKKRWYV